MIDILLVNPPIQDFSENGFTKIYNGSFSMQPPLGLCYIAAVLRENNYKVKILDMDILKLSLHNFIDFIKILKPKVVGISVTTVCYQISLKLAKIIKEFDDSISIIFGGFHPSLFPKTVIKEPTVDYVAIGEGEYTLLELANLIVNNSGKIEEINGIMYKTPDGNLKKTSERGFEKDLDNFPFPATDLIIGNARELYFSAIAITNPTTSMITQRGCPFQCTFCSKIFKKVRFRSAKNVIDEIELIKEKKKINDIQFIDSEFNLNKKLSREISLTLKKNKMDVYWRAVCRPDLVDAESIQNYKDGGCYILSLGAESGSDRILKFLKKGYNTSQIRTAFKLADKHNLETHGMFMVGIPGETTEDIMKTVKLIRETAPNYLQLTVYTPVAGTELFDLLVKQNLIKNNINYSELIGFQKPIMNLPNLSDKSIAKLRSFSRVTSILNLKFIAKILETVIKNPLRFPTNIGHVLKYSLQ